MPSTITMTVDGPTPWKLFLEGKISAVEMANVFYRKPIEDAVTAEMNRIANDIEKDFDSTADGWSERPIFVATPPNKSGDRISIKVLLSGPGERKWVWVNYGTRRHGITIAQKTGRERMPIRPYKARTTPGTIKSSRGGGVHGAPRAFAVSVMHPGVRARRFDQLIAQKYSSGKDSVGNQVLGAVRKLFAGRR